MKKHLKFECYNDPGHGWVKVKIEQLKKLDIVDKITSYSYMRNENAYLEEDIDASTFINALNEHGVDVRFHHNFTDRQSKIRSYCSYDPNKINQKGLSFLKGEV